MSAASIPRAGLAMLLAATMLWGVTFTLVGDVVAGRGLHGALVFIALRFIVATATLLLLGPYLVRCAAGRGWRPWLAAVFVGVITFAGFLTQTLGLLSTTPARSAFVTSASVVLVPFLAAPLLRRRLSRAHVGLSLLALVGIGFVVAPGGSLAPNRGDWWTLACAVFFAWQIVEVERATTRTPVFLLVFGQILATALCALLVLLLMGGLPWRSWPNLHWTALVTGVLCTSLCLFFVAKGQARVSSEAAALIFALEPICASLFDGYWRGRWLDGWQMVGGAIVIVSAVAAAMLERKAATKSKP